MVLTVLSIHQMNFVDPPIRAVKFRNIKSTFLSINKLGESSSKINLTKLGLTIKDHVFPIKALSLILLTKSLKKFSNPSKSNDPVKCT